VAYVLWWGSPEDLGHMIISEYNRDNDLEANPLKDKSQPISARSGSDDAVRLTPPVILSLEEAIAYMDDDECGRDNVVQRRKCYLDLLAQADGQSPVRPLLAGPCAGQTAPYFRTNLRRV